MRKNFVTKNIVVIQKEYTDESLLDVDQDIIFAVDEMDAPDEKDENGFYRGHFELSLIYVPKKK